MMMMMRHYTTLYPNFCKIYGTLCSLFRYNGISLPPLLCRPTLSIAVTDVHVLGLVEMKGGEGGGGGGRGGKGKAQVFSCTLFYLVTNKSSLALEQRLDIKRLIRRKRNW